MKQPLTLVVCLLLASLLGACSTPQPALTQANHTAKLMGLVDKEIAAFQKVVTEAQAGQVASLEEHRGYLAKRQAARAIDDRARASAGDSRTGELRKQLLADADYVASTQAAALAGPVSFKQQITTLLTPLSSSDAITKAQAKAAAMGTELSSETRRQELLTFLDGVKKSIDDNRKKVSEAKKEAAGATTETAAAVKKDTETMAKVPVPSTP